MSKLVVLAVTRGDGVDWAREHGLKISEYVVLTPHGNGSSLRGLRPSRFQIVGAPRFSADQLKDFAFAFHFSKDGEATFTNLINELHKREAEYEQRRAEAGQRG